MFQAVWKDSSKSGSFSGNFKQAENTYENTHTNINTIAYTFTDEYTNDDDHQAKLVSTRSHLSANLQFSDTPPVGASPRFCKCKSVHFFCFAWILQM